MFEALPKPFGHCEAERWRWGRHVLVILIGDIAPICEPVLVSPEGQATAAWGHDVSELTDSSFLKWAFLLVSVRKSQQSSSFAVSGKDLKPAFICFLSICCDLNKALISK